MKNFALVWTFYCAFACYICVKNGLYFLAGMTFLCVPINLMCYFRLKGNQ